MHFLTGIKGVFVLFACLLSFLCLSPTAQASHLMGGEITWECQGNGQYIFKLQFYRDCNGINTPSTVTLTVINHPTVQSVLLNLVSQTDISPACNSAGPTISCSSAESQTGWPTSSSPVAGAVQQSIFQSAPISLPGVPPTQGWTFAYSDCCRNGSLSNLAGANSYGFTLRAVMYAYNGQNAGPCFDSSPTFLESPSTVICLGAPFKYNHNAYDPDLDSLSYSFAQPLDDFSLSSPYVVGTNPGYVPYVTGYSYSSPLPGITENPSNVPATINAQTGEISFTSFTQGYFVTNVKVEAWKCGILVAEIYREIQIVLLPCAANDKPTVTYSSYQATVQAGTLVTFNITGADSGTLPDGSPQSVTINASGTQFGSNFTSSTSGCLNPPCATMSPALPTSSPTTVSSTFNWQTTCNHISYNSNCNTASNTYTFVFRVKDDFCPAPAENISTVSITVLATPIVPSPEVNCVSVLPNGDVELTWEAPPDPGGTFNGYFIYSSTSPTGPFTLIDSILAYSLSNTTYTHVGANANAGKVYYLVKTRSGCFGQVYGVPHDTVSTMFLTVNNPANGTAILSWNSICTPLPSTSSGIYEIYVENPTGVWTLSATTTNTNYIDTILACNAAINFRVQLADNTGCTSVSTKDGGTFQNIIVPYIPVFDTLSVDDANFATMSWNVNPATDVAAYVIYRLTGAVKIPIDTIYGINNINFTNLLSTAVSGSEEYYIAAFDTCGNISPISNGIKTIYLTSVPDICARSVTLNWTAYDSISLGTGLAGYNIWQSTIGFAGPYTLVTTVSSSTLTYTVASLAPQATYYYKVQAVDASGSKTASSNRITHYSATPLPPAFTYLRKVSVVDPNQVDITCHIDVAASTSGYKVIRSLDTVSANFKVIAILPASASTPVSYSDVNVETDKQSYYYKVINIDSCGFDGIITNIGRTILLSAISNSETFENTITWNNYEEWEGNVLSYNIYRGIDGTMDPTPIANVPAGSGSYTYTDDISTLIYGQGIFNYYVEALEGMGNSYGFSDNSLSNIAEAYQEPKVFIPNAFKPTGINKVFIPSTTFVDFTEYEFSIFNRWGDRVFVTNNVGEGWDGTDKSGKCQFDLYVYLVRFKTSKGEYIDFKGTVTLLR